MIAKLAGTVVAVGISGLPVYVCVRLLSVTVAVALVTVSVVLESVMLLRFAPPLYVYVIV